MANTLHNILTGTELHFAKIFTSPAVPSSIPTFVGQTYYNTSSNVFYIAIGTSSVNDWQPIVTTESVNPQSGTTYTVLTSDNGKLINMTSSSARTVTLLSAPVNGFNLTIFDGSGNALTNNIDIVTTGSDQFYNTLTTLKMVSNYSAVHITYDASTSKWLGQGQYIGDTLLVDNIFDTASIIDTTDLTKKISFQLNAAATGTATTLIATQTTNRSISFPDVTDTLTANAATQTLSNKTFSNNTNTTGITNDTNPVIVKSAQPVQFNNAGNTFHSSIQAGNNTSNLIWTLPIVAPTIGAFLSSTDTAGTLAWSGTVPANQTTVASATNINALTSSFTTVVITGATATNINGIVAGTPGQRITIINFVTNFVTLVSGSGSASAANRIGGSGDLNLRLSPGFSMDLIYNASNSLWYPIQTSAATIPGNLFTAAVGFIGEQQNSFGTGFSTLAPGWVELATKSLGIGQWMVSGLIQLSTGMAGGSDECSIYVGTDPIVNPAVAPVNRVIGQNSLLNNYGQQMIISPVFIDLSAGASSVYLNLYTSSNFGGSDASAYLTAIRYC